MLPGLELHHEHVDGAAILMAGAEKPSNAGSHYAVADTFDAMTTNRPSTAMIWSSPMNRFWRSPEQKFDRAVVDALDRAVRREKYVHRCSRRG